MLIDVKDYVYNNQLVIYNCLLCGRILVQTPGNSQSLDGVGKVMLGGSVPSLT